MERRAAGQAGYAAYMRDLLKSSDRRGQGLVSMERDGGVVEGEKKKKPLLSASFLRTVSARFAPPRHAVWRAGTRVAVHLRNVGLPVLTWWRRLVFFPELLAIWRQ